jgi:hypothetical protein
VFAKSLLAVAFLLTAACSTIPQPLGKQSTPEGLRLLELTQQAHGKEAFSKVKDIAVSYDGTWYTLVTKIQPLVTDPRFRGSSQERMIIGSIEKPGPQRVIAQDYSASGGKKLVVKSYPDQIDAVGTVSVRYNGKLSDDAAVNAASHLVLEAYQLFLYPAFYVQRASWFESAGIAYVNGHECDLLLAVMRPGIGASKEDRVMLYIDKVERLVRRVRLTLEGTATTAGAVVDTDLDKFITVAGVRWPSKFYEDLVSPFRGLPAHDFWLTGIDVNRGLAPSDLMGSEFSPNAAKPATSVEQIRK